MKLGEHKEINGYIVRKQGHPILRNRDGYAKAWYFIYENFEAMNAFKPIGSCATMAEAKALTRD